MKFNLYILILSCLILQSCISNKYLEHIKSENSKVDLKFFKSNSIIQIVEKGNKYHYNDSISSILSYRIDSIINTNKNKYGISGKIDIQNKKLEARINDSISSIFYKVVSPPYKLNKVKIPTVIDSLLKSRNQRFSIIIKGFGYIYDKENTLLKKIKGSLINVATIGFSGTPPITNQLSLSFIILDSKKNEVTTYISYSPIFKYPLDKEKIKQNLDNILIGNIIEKN